MDHSSSNLFKESGTEIGGRWVISSSHLHLVSGAVKLWNQRSRIHNHYVLLDNPKIIERLGLLSQPLYRYEAYFSFRLPRKSTQSQSKIAKECTENAR